MSLERFTWVGPLRRRGPWAEAGRAFVRGLLEIGCDVAPLDPLGPSPAEVLGGEARRASRAASNACEPLAEHLAAPVHASGSTVVWQAPLGELASLVRALPLAEAGRRVALTFAAQATLHADEIGALRCFDEVWVPSTFQRELLAHAGVPRGSVRVVSCGIGPDELAPTRVEPRSTTRLALAGVDRNLARDLRRLDLAIDVWDPSSADCAHAADLLLAGEGSAAGDDVDPFGRALLEALARGIPVVALENGAVLALAGEPGVVVVPAGAGVPAILDHVHRALGELQGLSEVARRSSQRVRAEHSLAAAARALLDRRATPTPIEHVARALRLLGLRTPDELLAGARTRVIVSAVLDVGGPWLGELRGFLAAHAPHEDVTLCLWIDETLAAGNGAIDVVTSAAEAEIARRVSPAADVMLVAAPLEHVPWARVERAEEALASPAATCA